MRKINNGKIYDTETAVMIISKQLLLETGAPNKYMWKSIYRTKKGNWFRVDNDEKTETMKLWGIPIDEAFSFLVKYSECENALESITKYFPDKTFEDA